MRRGREKNGKDGTTEKESAPQRSTGGKFKDQRGEKGYGTGLDIRRSRGEWQWEGLGGANSLDEFVAK